MCQIQSYKRFIPRSNLMIISNDYNCLKPLKINNLTRHHTSINMKEYRFTVTDLLMERPNLIAKKKIPVSLCEPES